MIELKGKEISTLVTTSVANQGYGFLAKRLVSLKGYNLAMAAAKKTRTTNILKSTTPRMNIGNVKPWLPWTALQYVQNFEQYGKVNAVALTNFGSCVNVCLSYLATLLNYSVMPSIFVQFDRYQDLDAAVEDAMRAVAIYSWAFGEELIGIDWNGSCGNSKEDIANNAYKLGSLGLEAQRRYPYIIHGIKVGEAHSLDVCVSLAEVYDYIHSMNSILMGRLRPGQEHTSPLFGLKNVNQGGSVSGLPIYEKALAKNIELARELEGSRSVRLILAGGITTLDQARYYFDHVIDHSWNSIGICTAVDNNPVEAIKMMEYFNKVN